MRARGEFRADLYYRINVIPIFLPPLRERPGDIALLARACIERFNAENGRKLKIAPGGMEVLKRCSFPGNVRELENCVRRAATLVRADVIGGEDLSCAAGECLSSQLWAGPTRRPPPDPIAELASGRSIEAPVYQPPQPAAPPLPAAELDEAAARACEHAASGDCPAIASRLTEKDRLLDAMERAGWVQAKAARILGISPRQIGYALRKYRIEMKHF